VIEFLIVAWVVFLLVKFVNRIKDSAVRKGEPVPSAPKGPTQEELLQQIRDLLATRGGGASPAEWRIAPSRAWGRCATRTD
jgi:large conductance mechanosensitive channel